MLTINIKLLIDKSFILVNNEIIKPFNRELTLAAYINEKVLTAEGNNTLEASRKSYNIIKKINRTSKANSYFTKEIKKKKNSKINKIFIDQCYFITYFHGFFIPKMLGVHKN
jgi:uncharacterized membrane protein